MEPPLRQWVYDLVQPFHRRTEACLPYVLFRGNRNRPLTFWRACIRALRNALSVLSNLGTISARGRAAGATTAPSVAYASAFGVRGALRSLHRRHGRATLNEDAVLPARVSDVFTGHNVRTIPARDLWQCSLRGGEVIEAIFHEGQDLARSGAIFGAVAALAVFCYFGWNHFRSNPTWIPYYALIGAGYVALAVIWGVAWGDVFELRVRIRLWYWKSAGLGAYDPDWVLSREQSHPLRQLAFRHVAECRRFLAEMILLMVVFNGVLIGILLAILHLARTIPGVSLFFRQGVGWVIPHPCEALLLMQLVLTGGLLPFLGWMRRRRLAVLESACADADRVFDFFMASVVERDPDGWQALDGGAHQHTPDSTRPEGAPAA